MKIHGKISGFNEMVCERLVCGINDLRIQRHLLQEPDLTYKKAFELPQGIDLAARDIADPQKQSLFLSTV